MDCLLGPHTTTTWWLWTLCDPLRVPWNSSHQENNVSWFLVDELWVRANVLCILFFVIVYLCNQLFSGFSLELWGWEPVIYISTIGTCCTLLWCSWETCALSLGHSILPTASPRFVPQFCCLLLDMSELDITLLHIYIFRAIWEFAQSRDCVVASSPDHSQILSGEGLVPILCHGLEMVDSVST